MPTFTFRRLFLAVALAGALVPARAFPGAGSGVATLFGPNPTTAGHRDEWTIQYHAVEPFASGGTVEVEIPVGWSTPQNVNSIMPGYFQVLGDPSIDSVEVIGRTVRLHVSPPFGPSSYLWVYYGLGGGNAYARAQSNAQASVPFLVRSDPLGAGTALPLAAQPSVTVTADPVVVSASVTDAAGAPVDTLTRTTDQDTTRLFLRGYDTFGNFARLIACGWTLSGGVGNALPASGTSTTLRLDRTGTGVVHADSAGVWSDSTGAITVRHGAYAGLEMTAAPGPTVAGSAFAVTARAVDVDRNTIDDLPDTAIRFVAFADSTGPQAADPSLVNADATLRGGAYADSLVALRAGAFWLAARDDTSGFLSARRRVDIVAASPEHLALEPDTLRLTAGAPDSVAVRILDPFGNRTPLLADETLTLWTDRPTGTFRDIAGTTTLFEITVPAGRDSARFTFTDTRTTSVEGRIRAIDANGTAPFLGTAGAPVFTFPSAPASIALGALPDTVVANGVDTVRVTGVATDAFGNAVAAGQRFTLTGSSAPSILPVTDDDPLAPGAQLLADATGTVRGTVRAGTAAGMGGATVTADSSPASATVSIRLLAGVPAGAIALNAVTDSLAADSVATLSIGASGLHDSGGNMVRNGETYTVATTLGAIVTPDSDPATPGRQVAASSGAISFTMLGGDVLGNAVVTAKAVRDTTSSGALAIRLVPGPVSAARSLVDASSPAPVGPVGSVVHVGLRDAQDHPVPGVPVSALSVTVTGVPATVAALGSATDGNGRIDFRATTTLADTARAHATADGVALAAQPDVIFLPGPIDHYNVSGPPGPLTAGLGQSLAVEALDAFGNSLPAESGEILTPTVISGSATVPASATLSGGRATLPFTPTQAAPLAIQISDGTRPPVTYGPVPVNPSGASTLTLAPDSLAAAPTQARLVTVTARDAQGNPVPGLSVTFYLGGPASGTLESSGSTSGGPGSQTGGTNSSGKVTVRYRAPSVAPALDSIFVSAGGVAPAAIRAITSPGPTASLRVLPRTRAWTAGVAESVLVQALDAFGNLVTADAAQVTPRSSGAVVWNPPSAPLVAGQLVMTGADTLAESVSIDADRAGGGTGSGGVVAVGPAAPAGAILIVATRDTLTADGGSASTVTLGPVRDAFGNLVGSGALVVVSAAAGTLVAPDQSALPGLDLATGADSKASVALIAPSVAAADTLRAVSRAGSASGAHAFLYLAPPTLAYVAGSLNPAAVTPGSAAVFSLQARNTGAGALQLGGSSTLSFGSGVTGFVASLASPVAIAPGATATLDFASASVSAAMPPGSYAPGLRAVGQDGTGAPFDFFPSLAGAQVSVLGVGVAAVSASPDPVPLGGALTLLFDVTNVSGTPGDLTGATVSYSAGAFLTGAPTPALGTTIPAGATTRFAFPAQVPAGGITPGATVSATLQATVTYGGNAVSGSNGTPLTFRVISAAQVAAVPGTGSPSRLLRGRSAGPKVGVANSGAAAVTLNRGTTRLVLDRGASVLATSLAAATAVPAGDQATLAFDSLAVPSGVLKGRYRARMVLDGVESGQSYADTVAFAPDSLDVVDPAILSVVAGSLTPSTVSAGQTRALSLTLRNDGDVPFTLDPSTSLRIGSPASTTLALGSAPTVNAGQSLALGFAGTLGTPAAPGDAPTSLDLLGLEDGVVRALSLAADTLHALAPAALRYVARSTAPSQARPGQTIDVTLDVENTGGSPFLVDPPACAVTLTDGTDVASAAGSGPSVSIAPGSRITLSFPSLAIPASMASQPYRVDLSLRGTEWGLSTTTAFSSPDSELVVLDPLAGLQVRAEDTAPPAQVALGTPAVRVWGLTLTPLAAVGAATSDSLRSVTLTVLTDGSSAPSPSAVVSSLALRDRIGTLLAQATPAGANPVTLVLVPPIALGNAPESLFVDASFVAGTQAERVAFQLRRDTDVVAVDVTTGALVPILGGGGLPFQTLTSPEITFFDHPHGYPNPFHAGSESILLSYVLGQDAAVKVSIYTLFGDLVRELGAVAGARGGSAGLNELPWDGRNGKGDLVRPGVYVAKVDGPGVNGTIKVGVLR